MDKHTIGEELPARPPLLRLNAAFGTPPKPQVTKSEFHAPLHTSPLVMFPKYRPMYTTIEWAVLRALVAWNETYLAKNDTDFAAMLLIWPVCVEVVHCVIEGMSSETWSV